MVRRVLGEGLFRRIELEPRRREHLRVATWRKHAAPRRFSARSPRYLRPSYGIYCCRRHRHCEQLAPTLLLNAKNGPLRASAYITRGLCRTNARRAAAFVSRQPLPPHLPPNQNPPRRRPPPNRLLPPNRRRSPNLPKPLPLPNRHRPIRRAPTSIHRARRGPPPANAQRTRASCFRAVRSRAARATADRAARGM